MKNPPHPDNLSNYDQAIAGLKSDPYNFNYKHQAVLALARSGSLEFAISEYKRYGLDQIRGHEDIMALDGRLSKDLYLTTSGKAALEHARDSAAKYERAFQDTKGYYCGVNAATMAFLADMPWDIVKDRIHTLLAVLPTAENLTHTDHYFIEATRAECHLLLNDGNKAQNLLKSAIDFDPLNYPAHATSLKQFGLILDKRGEDKEWLRAFAPPRPVHFAGHLRMGTAASLERLSLKISDFIQRHDIGFGYGALAAGSDILIAEALIQEGAELNIILPCDIDNFLQSSVTPYGQDWAQRFLGCLDSAHSVTCLQTDAPDFSAAHNILGARLAMGQAILRAQQLDVMATQLLIFDSKSTQSLTAHHREDWVSSGRESLVIELQQNVKTNTTNAIITESPALLLATSRAPEPQRFDAFFDVVTALETQDTDKNVMRVLHFDFPDAAQNMHAMLKRNIPGAIHVSEAVASYIALKHSQDFKVTFVGQDESPTGRILRSYSVRIIG